MGPLQLAIHDHVTWYKTAKLESKSRTGTRQTKGIHNFKWLCPLFVLSQYYFLLSSFVPREWLAAKGP